MNTVQTAVYDKTVYEFGEVACSRIRAELAAADVPVADVRFAHRGSLEGRGDERFRITVAVETSAADHAEETIREVLAEIDAEGNGITEEFKAWCRPLLGGPLPKLMDLRDE